MHPFKKGYIISLVDGFQGCLCTVSKLPQLSRSSSSRISEKPTVPHIRELNDANA